MRHVKVTFPNTRGQTLVGRLDLPLTGEPLAYALYANCFTCHRDLKAIGRISDTLAHHGIGTLRFDFTGIGDSGGEFSSTNFSSSVADYLSAAEFLRTEFDGPELLIGHSLGGAIAMAAGAKIESARAVISIAAPATPAHIERHISADLKVIEAKGRAEVQLSGRQFTLEKHFVDDIRSFDLASAINALRTPLLVIHSPIDNVVGIDNAALILDHARHPKSYLSLDGADHLISNEDDARYVAEVVATWANRYATADITAHSQPDFVAGAPKSVTTVRIEDGLRAEIVSNGFPLVADEPVSVGGTNTGPTPYDYLLTALGACTAMTLRMYADRKKWPLETVTVNLSHRKVHARDCAECESDAGFADHIDREVLIEGDLDDTQRRRLADIADRCPVHKTLHGEVKVRSSLVPSPV